MPWIIILCIINLLPQKFGDAILSNCHAGLYRINMIYNKFYHVKPVPQAENLDNNTKNTNDNK